MQADHTSISLSPSVISRVLSEIRVLVKSPPEGIEYVDMDESVIHEVHALIHGPVETPFYGGVFRLKLVLSEEYPATPPKGYFLTKIYHPNISNNGDICVNTLKKDWTPDTTLKHILQVIRCLLLVPFPESSLNDEAGKLFMDSYGEYARRARIMTSVHAMDLTKDSVENSMKSSNEGVDASSQDKTKSPNKSTSAGANNNTKRKADDAKKKGFKRL